MRYGDLSIPKGRFAFLYVDWIINEILIRIANPLLILQWFWFWAMAVRLGLNFILKLWPAVTILSQWMWGGWWRHRRYQIKYTQVFVVYSVSLQSSCAEVWILLSTPKGTSGRNASHLITSKIPIFCSHYWSFEEDGGEMKSKEQQYRN